MKRLALALTLGLAASLAPSHAEAWSTAGVWTLIRQGNHEVDSFTGSVGFISPTTVTMQVQFDASAIYTTQSPSNQADINKLWGYSDCSSAHQSNSARFGWRWYDNQLQLLGYAYKKGVWSSVLLTSLALDQAYTTQLSVSGTNYVFKVNGVQLGTLPRGCSGSGGIKYKLRPYFGGDEVAPHDVRIWLKRL